MMTVARYFHLSLGGCCGFATTVKPQNITNETLSRNSPLLGELWLRWTINRLFNYRHVAADAAASAVTLR